MSLRPYQVEGIRQIKEEFSKGRKRVLLYLATGAGKTVIFCEMAKGAVDRGKRVLVVVRRRLLVENASQRLFREGIAHGVLMAGHWNHRPHAPVQVASIDTLLARGITPEADLVIVDEAHDAVSNGYREILSQYDAFVVAVTATPFTGKSMRHLAESVVHPVTMQQLVDDGFLCPFRYFAPSVPDLSGVEISSSTQDYVTNQLEERMTGGQLTGDILHHWVKLAAGRPTILFAVNVHHSRLLADMFNNNGIKSEHCDADTPDEDRAKIIRRLESGETKIVCNVGILCTGVDIPALGAIIMARPTKSYNLFIQQAGRGTRIFPGKKDCILLDHAGNLGRHGFPTLEPEVDLDGKPKKETAIKDFKTCKTCFCMYRGEVCPECGEAAPPKELVAILVNEGELEELVASGNEIEQYMQILERQRREAGRKKAWIYYKLIERFPIDECAPYLPRWFLDQQNRNPFAQSRFSYGPK